MFFCFEKNALSFYIAGVAVVNCKVVVLVPAGFGKPGVDVMITIFCDFRQLSAKKIGVFLKNQCYD
jgi:hypothetical protein